MFCENCGAEVKKEEQFCEKCGTQVEKKNRKPMTKKQKIIGGIVLGVLIVLGTSYTWVKHQLSPEEIAKNYFLATMNRDVDKLYSYMNVNDSEFITKELFEGALENNSSVQKTELKNYTVGDANIGGNGLYANVGISYLKEGDDEPYTFRVELVKNEGKKYLFFDDWRVAINEKSLVKVVNDYKIKTLKGSILTMGGVEVDKKYIDVNASNEVYDVYNMPAIFASSYTLKVALPFGFEVERIVRVSSNSSYTIELDEKEIPDNVKEQMKETVKNGLQTLYDGAIAQKSFEEIKSAFEYEGANLDGLKSKYENLKERLATSSLQGIQFTEVNLRYIRNEKDAVEVGIEAKYTYSTTRRENNQSTMYMKVSYTIGEQAFKIKSVSDLDTYFF